MLSCVLKTVSQDFHLYPLYLSSYCSYWESDNDYLMEPLIIAMEFSNEFFSKKKVFSERGFVYRQKHLHSLDLFYLPQSNCHLKLIKLNLQNFFSSVSPVSLWISESTPSVHICLVWLLLELCKWNSLFFMWPHFMKLWVTILKTHFKSILLENAWAKLLC